VNFALGAALVIGILSFVFSVLRDIGVTMIFNTDAFLMVVGGTTIALFIGFPVERLRDTFHDIIHTFSKQRQRDDVIKDILMVSRMYRRTDVRSLEKRAENTNDGFLRLGVNLLVNDHGKREIVGIMEREMVHRMTNYSFSQNVLKTIARLTPAFGLAGTVISLIKMFRHLESVDTIAPLMAVALMSTFYGVIIANLFMLPLSAKVKEKAIVSESVIHLTIEGILSIKNGDHPIKIEEKLRGFREVNDRFLQRAGAATIVSKAGEVISRFQKA
jgi:chemotaxis protein MotA